jgi:transcriptional regulator GlxA family with amidase domain
MRRRTYLRRAVFLAACVLVLALSGWVFAPACADPPGLPDVKKSPATAVKNRTLGIVLYPKFELLDVYGPAEIFGNLGPRVKVVMVAASAGPVASVQGPKTVAEYGFDDCPDLDLVLVPGGIGTLAELKNQKLHEWLRQRAAKAEIVMSVCSGSAILARAGLLDGRRATSNKQYFSLAVGQGPKVKWVKEARWVDDGDRVTSSGVSAGMDMALHVVARLFGEETAQKVADGTEYQWHRDADKDPFAKFAK